MKLNSASIEWALESLAVQGDTDLFPRPPEFAAVFSRPAKALSLLNSFDLASHEPGPARRFIVPKDDLSYRVATQLYPLDSLLMTAALHEYGSFVETRRVPIAKKEVFSYRFDTSEGELYGERTWNDFWAHCRWTAHSHPFIVTTDISDFYNQIYHHTVENQFVDSTWPNQVTKLFLRTYEAMTAEVSRGIPISPYTSHLVAEATLIPIDASLESLGVVFCRYADDIVMFCESMDDARRLLFELARILDVQQRLQLQRGKTQIYDRDAFRDLCDSMIEDRPINDLEKHLLEIIERYSDGDPYQVVLIGDIDEEDLREFSTPVVEQILQDYLQPSQPDYIRLRWFLRRLGQIGHPAGVNFCLSNFKRMRPAVSEMCRYFIAVNNAQQVLDWKQLGQELQTILEDDVVNASEYALISVVGLFGAVPELNHLQALLKRYDSSSPAVRREIIIAAASAGATDWIRGLKESFLGMDDWSRSAYLYATRTLISEERKYFLNKVSPRNVWEQILIDYSKHY